VEKFSSLQKQATKLISFWLFLLIAVCGLIVTICLLLGLSPWLGLASSMIVALIASFILAPKIAASLSQPLAMIWQASQHIAAHDDKTPAPDLTKLKYGHDIVSELTSSLYQFASQQNSSELIEHRKQLIQAANIVAHMPLPLFVFNKEQVVINASTAALQYCQVESSQLFGKALHDSIDMEFPSEYTLDEWIKSCQDHRVTDTSYWQRVRIRLADDNLRQCDIAAYYNRDNPSGTEFIVTLFDRTDQYNHDDTDLSFVALAVHELRTPLTMLRGYIEVFEDEVAKDLNEEMKSYLAKMHASAQQLGAFFNNILNVARIDQNQLSLTLTEASWADIITKAVEELQLRANVHNRRLVLNPVPKLPSVAVDQVSILEVLNNLVDNAIKYTRENGNITIDTSLNEEGLVQTTVSDDGVGIPTNIVPNLFDKFYRNHRTSRSVGGTGLGLFLCKSIIGAHGGQVWVKSKEGEGSTFGFSLVPYSNLSEDEKQGTGGEVVRGAHGWIKNHSLYRR
jgi:two-component system, OmpR family, sensor histidine kinase VicK